MAGYPHTRTERYEPRASLIACAARRVAPLGAAHIEPHDRHLDRAATEVQPASIEELLELCSAAAPDDLLLVVS